MGFNLGHWLLGAGKAIGREVDSLATGVFSVAKAAFNQPVAIVHELSGAAVGISKNAIGVAHEASGALVGVSSNLTMPLMVGGLALGAFMLTRR